MSEKASVIDLSAPVRNHPEKNTDQDIFLSSGRRIKARSEGRAQDLLEVREADGKLVLKILLTDQGPVLEMTGVRLEMSGAKSISLEAETIDISAKNTASINSKGEMRLSSEKDVRVTGEIIHLN